MENKKGSCRNGTDLRVGIEHLRGLRGDELLRSDFRPQR